MRACIILGVIAVHTISNFNVHTKSLSGLDFVSSWLVMSFHFTREAFMFITGLVLFYTYYDREFKVFSFWRKRLFLIAIPYVAWTAIYILYEGTYFSKFHWTVSYLTHTFVKGLWSADMFFLYFLMVSMQLYVVFPLMIKFMRKFQRGHLWLFFISLAVEIGLMVFNQAYVQFVNIHDVPGWVGLIVKYRDRIIITYEFWFIAGALLAVHYQDVKAWALRHVRLLVSLLLFGLIVLWGVYFMNRFAFGLNDSRALDALQPVMIPYSLVVAAMLWLVGLKWQATSSSRPRLSRVIRFFGSVSFGIFLFHPVALHYVDKISSLIHASKGVHFALLPIWIVLAYVLSGGAAYVVGKIPYVSYIVGEKTKFSRRTQNTSLSKAV